MILNELQHQTIYAALCNGLGLTHACKGLQLDPKEVSAYIVDNPTTLHQCKAFITQGYQALLNAINESQNKSRWDKWAKQRDFSQSFIVELALWGDFCSPEEFSFENFTLAIHRYKTLAEVATAMAMSETDLLRRIYDDDKVVQWLIENGFKI